MTTNPHRLLTPNSHQFSPPAGVNLIVKSALEDWKSARRLLSSAIQSYLATCATLRISCAMPLHQPAERSIVEEALVTVDSELESLASEEQALYGARMSLGTMRNHSATLARVNTLPPEILARIFMSLRTYCIRDRNAGPGGFADVCVYWRRVAMDVADLWTHIDLNPNTPNSLPKLLLERSRDAPIHVHIFEPLEGAGEGPYGNTPQYGAEEIMTVLSPHLHRVRSFEVESGSQHKYFVLAALEVWLCHGNFGSLRSLVIHRPNSWHFLYLPLHETSKDLEERLPALNMLHLDNVIFDWNNSIFRGLVDLRLSLSSGVSITMPQLANLLSTSPALATLKLGLVKVDNTEDWTQPASIVMEKLKVLNLVEMDPEDAMLLLSLITLTSPLVGLSMQFSTHNTSDSRLADSLTRSRITTLCCLNDGSLLASWKPLKCLPYLCILVLHHYDMVDIPEDEINPPPSQSLSLPHLPSVILLRCRVSLGRLNNFVAEYNIQELRLEECEVATAPRPSQGVQAIQTSLFEAYPDLQCSVSDIDSTRLLACRTMFDL